MSSQWHNTEIMDSSKGPDIPENNVDGDLKKVIHATVQETIEKLLPDAVAEALDSVLKLQNKRIDASFAKIEDVRLEAKAESREIWKEFNKICAHTAVTDNDTRLKNVRINGFSEDEPTENTTDLTRGRAPTNDMGLDEVNEDIPLFCTLANASATATGDDLQKVIKASVQETLDKFLPDTVAEALDSALKLQNEMIDAAFAKIEDNKLEAKAETTENWKELDKIRAHTEVIDNEQENGKDLDKICVDTEVIDNDRKNCNEILALSEFIDHDERLKNVRIFGLPEWKPRENIINEIRVLANYMGLDSREVTEDINVAYRVGHYSTVNFSNPRPILVKFKSYEVRDKFIYARNALKGRKIFINDDLSPAVAREYAAMRKKVQNGQLFKTWTTKGRIWVIDTKNEEPMLHKMKYY